MSYKFIFDTNVLDNESIEALRKADLQGACQSGRYAFYVTPVLLKERLDFASKGKIPLGAIEPIKFLLDLKWQRLFNEPGGSKGIFALELERKPQSQYLFADSSTIKENLRFILNGGELNEEAKRLISDDKKSWLAKKSQNKDTYRWLRDHINQKLKHKPLDRKKSRFSKFLKTNFELTAIDKIKKNINSIVDKNCLVECWKTHKNKFPYFNKFIEGWLFAAWYPMASEQEPKIDKNVLEDIEHLIYLIGVDGIISNEKGFIKTASKELFPGKDFMSVARFVKKIKICLKL